MTSSQELQPSLGTLHIIFVMRREMWAEAASVWGHGPWLRLPGLNRGLLYRYLLDPLGSYLALTHNLSAHVLT